MRVGIIALLQESNTFIGGRTTIDQFAHDLLLRGDEVRVRLAEAHHEVGGFFEGLTSESITPVPIFAARALPYGMLTSDTFATLIESMRQEVGRAGPLDGLLVAPHGATVGARHPDVDGAWLALAREWVGTRCPIVSTLDPHANLSRAMLEACDGIVAYRTNPHVDQRAIGIEAAGLLARMLRGEIRPTMAASCPPLAIGIERQLTDDAPCREWYARAARVRSQPGVLSVSLLLGFPYADVAEMGSSVIVVTNDDPGRAERLAGELAEYAWTHRAAFVGRYIAIPDAVARASATHGRVCLLDMGDNVGAGSPADGTLLAAALEARGEGSAFACLHDPAAVQAADARGEGARLELAMGGKTDDMHGPPLVAPVTVLSLHDGPFEETHPRHGGLTSYDQGRTAIVRTDAGVTIMLTSRRVAPWSLEQLRSCGLDPAAFHVLVAKGVHAPVAAYAEICDCFIRVDTPGVATADMTRLPYRHRRRPMFPFEPETAWRATGASESGQVGEE